MSKLLHIDTSIQTTNSVSRRLSAAAVDRLQAIDPVLEVTYRDLAVAPLPHLSEAVFGAMVQPLQTQELSAAQQDDVAYSAAALNEFQAADTVVIGVSFYNYSVPSTLRSWIDRVVVAGKTFRYGPSGAQGLAGGKRVIVLIARGGIFAAGSPNAAHEHAETYLRSVFSLIGINNLEVIIAEGLAISEDHRDAAIRSSLESISALAG